MTFNEESMLHFSCLKAFDAQTRLEELTPTAQRKTKFSVGIMGIHSAIRQDASKLPARVVFLSDGEPSDPDDYLRDVQKLIRKFPGDALKIYAVGFGESAKVNSTECDFVFLQQLASMGRGHFQRCGASLSSLQGAFTALTSTISKTRSGSSREASRVKPEAAGVPASSSSTGSNPWDAPMSSIQPPSTTIPTIQEDDGEGSDDDEKGQDRGYDPNCPANLAEFELPDASAIFRDMSNSQLWKDFQTAQTTFTFDGRQFNRKCSVQRVFLRRKPFMKGGMRLVYGMVHGDQVANVESGENWMCAKRMFQDLEKEQGFQAHAAFCKSTAVAAYYAKLFRTVTRLTSAKVNLGFLNCHLYSPVGQAQEGGYHFCG